MEPKAQGRLFINFSWVGPKGLEKGGEGERSYFEGPGLFSSFVGGIQGSGERVVEWK